MSSDKRQKIISMLNEVNLQTNEIIRLILGVAKHGHFDSVDQINDFCARMSQVQSCIVHLTTYHNQTTNTEAADSIDPNTLTAEELDQLKNDSKLKAVQGMQESLELYFRRVPTADHLSVAIRKQKKTIFDLFATELCPLSNGIVAPGFSDLQVWFGDPLNNEDLLLSNPSAAFFGTDFDDDGNVKPQKLLLKSEFGWFVVVFDNVVEENDIYGEGRFYNIYKNTHRLDESSSSFIVSDFTRSTQSVISMLLGRTALAMELVICKSLSPLTA